jgi:MFS family permease
MNETGTLAPLRHRNFAVVWSGSFISNVGTWMQAAGLGYYTVHLTRSAGWGAAVAAAEFAPTALLGPVGGAIADRWSRRTIFLVATLAQAVLAGVLAVAMSSGTPGAPVIALYALANGCVFALGFPSFQAILPELVPTAELSGAIGLSSASWNLGRVLGPVLGIVVYQHFGIGWVLGTNAISFFAVVVALLALDLPTQQFKRTPLLRAIVDGLRFVRQEPGLRLNVAALCLNTLFVAPFIGLIPAFVEKVFNGTTGDVGWLIAAQGLGAVVMGVSFGTLATRYEVRRVMTAALVGAPLALIAYGLAPDVPIAAAALLATGAAYFAALSSFSTIAQTRAPAEYRGRVVALNQVVLGTLYAISVNVEGQLGDRLGLRTVMVGGAAISLLTLFAFRLARPGSSAVLATAPAVRPPVATTPD